MKFPFFSARPKVLRRRGGRGQKASQQCDAGIARRAAAHTASPTLGTGVRKQTIVMVPVISARAPAAEPISVMRCASPRRRRAPAWGIPETVLPQNGPWSSIGPNEAIDLANRVGSGQHGCIETMGAIDGRVVWGRLGQPLPCRDRHCDPMYLRVDFDVNPPQPEDRLHQH